MSLKRNITLFLSFTILLAFSEASADTIVLKNGLTLKGKFKGGTEKTIKFETSGTVQEIAINEVKSITFSADAQPVPSTAGQGSATALPPAQGAATALPPSGSVAEIPAGTKIMIKTTQPISTAQHKAGAIIEAALELDLKVNGVTVAPKGSKVYGKVLESVGGRRIGLQRIVVKFDNLVINGKKVPIETEPVGAEGGRGSAAKMIGAGAIFGAAGGDAGKGAAIGAGIALLAGGKHIQIPAGSKVELTIKNPVKLK